MNRMTFDIALYSVYMHKKFIHLVLVHVIQFAKFSVR